RGEEAKKVGYCIADGLGRGYLGNREEGLYFTGANGYRVDKIISVHELIKELTEG
ncbi:nitronate monooxygenase, partial [Helicobacter pylori]